MARVPPFPYRVVTTVKVNDNTQRQETHNYQTLAGAIVRRDIALRKFNTRKVEVLMVLDESSPSHRDEPPSNIR